MRIPNLNVSQSVTQKIRDLDLERFKLDKQITTGQKISLPEDGGLTMSRVIQLDSTKSKLAQYQRNASYATEFINAGHLNLEKLRDINQRAQEVARLAGSNLNGPAVEAYGLEIDQLIEEALNRVNATQRGRTLFAGTELKPDFAHSDVVPGQMEKKILDLNSNSVGIAETGGRHYLKQGDEVVLRANGREYVVQAKLENVSLFSTASSYNKGDLAFTIESKEAQDGILIDAKEFSNQNDILNHMAGKDWSQSAAGSLTVNEGSHPVYELSFEQIEQLAVSLGAQPTVDFFPRNGGFFALIEDNGTFTLEPAENDVAFWNPSNNYAAGDFVRWGQDIYQSKKAVPSGSEFTEVLWGKVPEGMATNAFKLSNNETIHYWEALSDDATDVPSYESSKWISYNPFERASNVSVTEVNALLRDLINNDPFFLSESQTSVLETDLGKEVDDLDYVAFTRASSIPGDYHSDDLDLRAIVASNGQLEVTGTVGQTFTLQSQYSSHYDTRNYFPVQLEQLLEEKAVSMFPVSSYDDLSEPEKQIVWREVQESKLTWDLSVGETKVDGDSKISIKLSEPWKRLEIYDIGDVVEFEGKLWESKKAENFNHFPNKSGSDSWKEIGSGYEIDREDWKISKTGNDSRLFWVSPDGKLFDGKTEAFNHAVDLVTRDARLNPESSSDLLDASGNLDNNKIRDKASSLIKQVAFPIDRFEVEGSESNGIVFFDVESQSYRLTVQNPEEQAIEGIYSKGDVYGVSQITPPPAPGTQGATDPFSDGDVVQFRGSYYIITNSEDAVITNDQDGGVLQVTDQQGEIIQIQKFGDTISTGEKFFDENSNRVYLFAGSSLPTEGLEPFVQPGADKPLRSGSFVYLSDMVTNDAGGDGSGFYLATEDIDNAGSDSIIDPQTGLPVEGSSKLVKVSAYNSPQGAEWSANKAYLKGQIVLHEGVYYECQTNGVDGLGFNNQRDEEETVIGLGRDGKLEQQFIPIIGSPSDEFFKEGLVDARSQDYIDILRAQGEPISNNVWLPVSNPLNHVFSFDVTNINSHDVNIATAGKNGIDAQISVQSDIDGKVFGLKVDDPGRYFFPQSDGSQKIPEEYRTAYITMNDGQSFEAKILWDQNPNDPGPYIISGLEILGNIEVKTNLAMGSSLGDNFSLATGNKTFLDHRDSDGKVLSVTYTGSGDNAEFFVGNESKVSSFLNANDGNTAELASVVESLVELRDGLSQENLSDMAQIVQSLGEDLIMHEEAVIDKMGELSATLVRMNTVRAHDEDYHLEIDQRLAKDLDVDLSEAIMQLTRVSTAYQAAMQVGAQLLNTSLLNYL